MSENRLCEYLHKLDRPCVFRGMLSSVTSDSVVNSCCEWTPDKLADVFAGEKFTFRMGKRAPRHENYKTQFENECEYVEAEVSEFIEWLSRAERSSNKRAKLEKGHAFERFDSNEEFWAYADYKYMIELLDTARLNQNCIDWRSFGFADRNARHSTLWIGSEGAYTPCHFDTYGYNLVAQIYGKKRWTMFPKSDSAFMYPTRVPFEESTVYSRVNIKSPDLTQFPLFKNAKPHVIELEPGDVLYVPKNWWHFVENCETSISINTWVELEIDDNYSRLKEIVSKTVLQSLMDSNMIEFDKWINSSENYTSQEENMEMVKKCLDVLKSQSTRTEQPVGSHNYERLVVEKHANFVKFVDRVGIEKLLAKESISPARDDKPNVVDYLVELSNAATQPNVVEMIARNLLNNLGINHEENS